MSICYALCLTAVCLLIALIKTIMTINCLEGLNPILYLRHGY